MFLPHPLISKSTFESTKYFNLANDINNTTVIPKANSNSKLHPKNMTKSLSQFALVELKLAERVSTGAGRGFATTQGWSSNPCAGVPPKPTEKPHNGSASVN